MLQALEVSYLLGCACQPTSVHRPPKERSQSGSHNQIPKLLIHQLIICLAYVRPQNLREDKKNNRKINSSYLGIVKIRKQRKYDGRYKENYTS